MKWEYYGQQQLSEIALKSQITGNWWTDAINAIQIQLTSKAVKSLYPSFNEAFNTGKPITFFLANNLRCKIRDMDSKHGKEFLINSYSEDIYTDYDPSKINHLATNSINQYFTYYHLPGILKKFSQGVKD